MAEINCDKSLRSPLSIITKKLFAVLGLYKTIVSTENEKIITTSRIQRLYQDNVKAYVESGAEVQKQSQNMLSGMEIKDLQEARERIRYLEEKLLQIEEKMENQALKSFPVVKFLNYKNRKRVLVTGGAGFVGSHLVDRLMIAGHEVIVVDNFFTGRKRNIEHWVGHENFELVHHDIIRPLYLEVDEIYHLASPASPPHYMLNPVKTIKTNTLGTINMLGR